MLGLFESGFSFIPLSEARDIPNCLLVKKLLTPFLRSHAYPLNMLMLATLNFLYMYILISKGRMTLQSSYKIFIILGAHDYHMELSTSFSTVII